MRIAPVLIRHLRNPSTESWAVTALAAMVTHNDAASIAARAAFVNMHWKWLRMETSRERLSGRPCIARKRSQNDGSRTYRAR